MVERGMVEEGKRKKKSTDSWIQVSDPLTWRLGTLCTLERRHKRIIEVKQAVQHPVLGIEKVIVGVAAIVDVSNHAGRSGCRGRQAWGAWC